MTAQSPCPYTPAQRAANDPTLQGFVEDISDVYAWHIGCYGRFEP
jgi:hypothetical protein